MPAPESPFERSRLGWWLYIGLLALVAGYIAYSFVGILSLGIFGYYATRPIYREIRGVIDSDSIVAWVTIVVVLGPILLLLAWTGFHLFQQAQQAVGETGAVPVFTEFLATLPAEERESVLEAIRNPRDFVSDPRAVVETLLRTWRTVLSAVFDVMLTVALAVTLTYFLLETDDTLSDGLRQLFGGRDTTAYGYAATVDVDLQSVFFGNFLFVIAMSIIATAAYWATNYLAPAPLSIPMVPVLGFLTGVASLIPLVVGKVVYVPVLGYLAYQASTAGEVQLAFVGAVAVAYFAVLDFLPQTFLQPYVAGRDIDMVLMMFAYLLGPVLFGWYGFFLLPILFVLMLEAVRLVLPELLHGEPLSRYLEMGESVGADPVEAQDALPEEREADGTDRADGAETSEG